MIKKIILLSTIITLVSCDKTKSNNIEETSVEQKKDTLAENKLEAEELLKGIEIKYEDLSIVFKDFAGPESHEWFIVEGDGNSKRLIKQEFGSVDGKEFKIFAPNLTNIKVSYSELGSFVFRVPESEKEYVFDQEAWESFRTEPLEIFKNEDDFYRININNGFWHEFVKKRISPRLTKNDFYRYAYNLMNYYDSEFYREQNIYTDENSYMNYNMELIQTHKYFHPEKTLYDFVETQNVLITIKAKKKIDGSEVFYTLNIEV